MDQGLGVLASDSTEFGERRDPAVDPLMDNTINPDPDKIRLMSLTERALDPELGVVVAEVGAELHQNMRC